MAKKILYLSAREHHRNNDKDLQRQLPDWEVVTGSIDDLSTIALAVIYQSTADGLENMQALGEICLAKVVELRRQQFTGPILVMCMTDFRPRLLQAGVTVWLPLCTCSVGYLLGGVARQMLLEE